MGIRGKKEQQHHPGNSQHRSRQFNPYVLTTPFVVMVLLHFIGLLFPGNMTWGFNFWSVVNPGLSLVVFGVALLLLFPPITQKVATATHLASLPGMYIRRAGRPTAVIVVSVCVLALLYFFRSKALVYGDGYSLASDAGEPGAVTFHFQYKFQILAIYFHRYVCQFINSHTSLSIEQAYALVNSVGGVIGLWAIVRISRQITSKASSRVFVLLGALSSGSVILFFGYIESYTFATAFALWTTSFAIGYNRRENGVLGVVVFALLAFSFHMITLPFVIVGFAAGFIRESPSGSYLFGVRLRAVNIILAAGSVVFVALSQMANIDIFVPLLPGTTNTYWAFSIAHINDIFNELILVAGPGLSLMLFVWFYGRKQVFGVGTIDGILGMATLLTFLAAFWIDPSIGAPRDWDLLSLVGFPLTIWAMYRFVKLFPSREVPSRWTVPVVVVLCIHLGANLYEKNQPDLAISRLDGLLSGDVHYQSEHQQARRCSAWAAILTNEVDRGDLAIKYLTRRVAVAGEPYRSCFGLGDIYGRLGQLDSAAKYITLGLEGKPDEIQFMINLAKIEKMRGRYVSAIEWGARVVQLEPGNVDALTELGIAHGKCDRYEEALEYFRRAYVVSPATPNQSLNLGLCYGMLGRVDSAYFYVCLALPLVPENARVKLYGYVIAAAIELGEMENAENHLDELRMIAPAAPGIPDLTAKLANARKP